MGRGREQKRGLAQRRQGAKNEGIMLGYWCDLAESGELLKDFIKAEQVECRRRYL